MVNVQGRIRKRDDNKGRKSGFVYRERSAEDVKERASRTGGRFDSPFKGNYQAWRPKNGDNNIRILPPTWDDHKHFGYTIWVHGFIGQDNSTYLCRYKMLDKKCPVCTAAQQAKESGDADEAKALQPTEKTLYWILDRNDNDNHAKPQLFLASWSMDREIVTQSISARTGKILLIDHDEQGYDLYFKRTGQGLNTRYIGYQFDRDPSPILPDEDEQEEVLIFIQENPLPDVLHYHSVEHLENVLMGGATAKEDDKEDSEEDDDGRRDKMSRAQQEEREARQDTRQSKRGENEIDDDDDDDDDKAPAETTRSKSRRGRDADEDEETPRRRAKASNGEDEDEPIEDDDEEEGEREEEPAVRRGRKRDDDDIPPERPTRRPATRART